MATEVYALPPNEIVDLAVALGLMTSRTYTIEVTFPRAAYAYLWERESELSESEQAALQSGGHVLRWGYPREMSLRSVDYWYVRNHTFSEIKIAVTQQ